MENIPDKQQAPQTAETLTPGKKEKLPRKERRKRWKAAKKARRDEKTKKT